MMVYDCAHQFCQVCTRNLFEEVESPIPCSKCRYTQSWMSKGELEAKYNSALSALTKATNEITKLRNSMNETTSSFVEYGAGPNKTAKEITTRINQLNTANMNFEDNFNLQIFYLQRALRDLKINPG